MDEVIPACLRAAVESDLFEGWEFHTLMGLHRNEVAAILDAWPDPPQVTPSGYETAEDAQRTAVNNVLNNLLGYPHGQRGDAFERVVGVTEMQVAEALRSWRKATGLGLGDSGAKGYFDRLT